MQNKLQELTDKLYNEGLAKGKQDADNLLAKAREEAAKIVADAKEQAEKIIADAGKQAEDLKTRTEGDVKMASIQALAALRQQIGSLVETRAVGSKVNDALVDKAFVGKLIATVAGAFKADGSAASLDVILPEDMKAGLQDFLAKNIDKELAGSLSFGFSDDFAGGFRIAPKDGGYYLDFTDESFRDLIGEYLRPATAKILFG
jgi:V/A-type H+-transporting ATPase subunit E